MEGKPLGGQIENYLGELDLKERYVIKWLYGFGIDPIPPKDISEALGLSLQEIGSLHRDALRELRNRGFVGEH